MELFRSQPLGLIVMQNLIEFTLRLSEAKATIISTFAALLLGFLGYIDNKNRQKREYTLNVFLPLLIDDKLAEAYNLISDLIIQNKTLNRSEMNEREIDLSVHPETA